MLFESPLWLRALLSSSLVVSHGPVLQVQNEAPTTNNSPRNENRKEGYVQIPRHLGLNYHHAQSNCERRDRRIQVPHSDDENTHD